MTIKINCVLHDSYYKMFKKILVLSPAGFFKKEITLLIYIFHCFNRSFPPLDQRPFRIVPQNASNSTFLSETRLFGYSIEDYWNMVSKTTWQNQLLLQ